MARSIKFSEQELEILISNYQMELGEALDYVDQIKSMLAKLGAPVDPPKEAAAEKKARKPKAKRGPKAKKTKTATEEAEANAPVKKGRKAKVAEPETVPAAE